MSAQFKVKLPDGVKRSPPSYIRHMLKVEESAHRRFLSSVTALAKVRKLQANTPGVQFNTQINLR
jgi:hypothetical protein